MTKLVVALSRPQTKANGKANGGGRVAAAQPVRVSEVGGEGGVA